MASWSQSRKLLAHELVQIENLPLDQRNLGEHLLKFALVNLRPELAQLAA